MRKNYVSYLGWGVLIVVFTVLCIFISFHMEYLINADDSSELILSKLISDEGGILSRNWYYTTELRVLNTQLVWSFLFNFIDDWHTVRIIGNVIWYLILLISLKLFCNELNLKKYYPFIAVLFILPKSFQSEYFDVVLKGIYYIPHIIIALIMFSMLLIFGRISNKNKSIVVIIISIVISILSGLNGLRYLWIFYIPLLLATSFNYFTGLKEKKLKNTNKKLLFYAVVITMGAFCGYLINNQILSEYFKFDMQMDIKYINCSADTLMMLINGWLNTLGYSVGGTLFSKDLIYNITSVVVVLTTIYSIWFILKNRKIYNNKEQILVLFYIFVFLLFFFIFLFTDLSYFSRYNIPIIVFGYIIIFLCFQKKNKKIIMFIIVLLSLMSGVVAFNDFSKLDINYEKRYIVEVLKNQGSYNGYATFWNANILTELSNGEIEVWSKEEGDDFDNICLWGQLINHSIERPKGKIFVLLTTKENYNSGLSSNSSDKIIYNSEEYVLYLYDSYDELYGRFN